MEEEILRKLEGKTLKLSQIAGPRKAPSRVEYARVLHILVEKGKVSKFMDVETDHGQRRYVKKYAINPYIMHYARVSWKEKPSEWEYELIDDIGNIGYLVYGQGDDYWGEQEERESNRRLSGEYHG